MPKFKKKNKNINYDMAENLQDTTTTNHINWFPGHMNKAIRQIKERIKKVDIILEIRDARSPLVTGNKEVHKAIGPDKCRLIVINKLNLADLNVVKKWEAWFETQGVPFIFINGLNKSTIKKVVEVARQTVFDKKVISNPDFSEEKKKKIRMMTIGLPNTGKSTIINMLANRNASKAADTPGLTRQQLWIRIDEDIEMLDTPGVMPPRIEKHEHGLWLAALHAIPTKVVAPEMTACFIVEYMLETKNKFFAERYKFENLDVDLVSALDQIAKIRGCIRHKGESDYDRVYQVLLSDFRDGTLGPISFGVPPLPRIKKEKDTK
jgi:ribosome biogenesis GTPase A